jgi:nitronate monooxygenase
MSPRSPNIRAYTSIFWHARHRIMAPSLQHQLPWTKSPLVVNAPMGGFAGPDLAIAVSKAGGLGQIGALDDMVQLEKQLQEVSSAFSHQSPLPIGVGLITFIPRLFDTAIPVLKKHSPAVVWLFAAPDLSDYAKWTSEIREACPRSKIWVQVGSVSGALGVARTAKPDALIMQGADAGGHGFEKGAGIISLVPEAKDTLALEGCGDIPLLASGGITNGRSAASALTLGAEGVVVGTRFLSAEETTVHPKYQAAIIAATDGGQSTVRAKLFDELRGPNIWPEAYDGRSIRTNSYLDHVNGVNIEQVRDLHAKALKEEDLGWGESNRATVWAGTGVGLVKKVQPAAEIVEEIRADTKKALEETKARL